MKKKVSITINTKILRDIDSIVDNIFIRNRSQAFEYMIKKALKENKIAVILAGKSSISQGKIVKDRYAFKINHSTIIEKAIKKLSDSGFKNIYIIADHDNLTNVFKIIGDGSSRNLKIEYVDEENPEGTASALKLLKGKVKTTFLVIWCDIIFDKVNLDELWRQHLQEKTVSTLLLTSSITPISDKKIWGYVKLEGNKIVSYVEKPVPKNITSSIFFRGIFVAEPEIFSYSGKSLEFDVFPDLVKRGLLGGQISSAEYLHAHNYTDLRRVKKQLN